MSLAGGPFAASAGLYDLLYGDKPYTEEARHLAGLVRARVPDAGTLLDVACGTGSHARAFEALGFEVDGLELDPDLAAAAREKIEGGRIVVGDMCEADLGRRYDVVTCLFSSVGYLTTPERLHAALARMAGHVAPGGLVLVEPWFEPGDMTDRFLTTRTVETEDVHVCRMSVTRLDGPISRLEFAYLVGRTDGIERLDEVHELRMWTREEMGDAFRASGLDVEHLEEGPSDRGLYVGSPRTAAGADAGATPP